MLVISREIEEEIVIGDDITIRFLGLRHGEAKLGITAPPDVQIWRSEVLEQRRMKDATNAK